MAEEGNQGNQGKGGKGGKGRKRGKADWRSRSDKGQKQEHSHPGGTGAILGTHLAKYSSFQGLSLLFSNILHYASLIVVARFLGPGSLGNYALLFFLTGVVSQVIHLLSKPGTMMRTFGISDDDSDDIEGDDEESGSVRPNYTLGVGIVWTMFLAATVITLTAIFQTSIASFLLGDPGQGQVVMFASITGGVWAIFKLTEMVVWFEGRPLTFAFIDAARPAFNLTAIIVILAMGAGVKGAIIGQTIGTVTATAISIVLVWKSFLKVFSFGELKEILKRGAIRIPIATSLWVVQNSDSFILSRFLDHKSIGLYQLASRTGFMVAFLPQGFRIALRPVRKSAAYEAFRREYGIAVANGQMLAYFYLITLTAILAMVLGGEILITIGGPKFASAAPLVPLTAAAMSMPALFRTVAAMAVYPYPRRIFVWSAIFVGVAYVGLAVLLLSSTGLGIYAPPIAMIIAFMLPSTLMFALSQFGKRPIRFPYLLMLEATLVAVALAVSYHFSHPANEWIQVGIIAVLMIIWLASLFVLRIIPRHHWEPLRHIARSVLKRGSALKFDEGAGLNALAPRERMALHLAVVDRIPDETLVPSLGDGQNSEDAGSGFTDEGTEGARLVRLLRRAGSEGGISVPEEGEFDAGVSLFLFSDQPVAVRLRKMRQLLAMGVDAHELRTLEDLRNDLATISAKVWEDGKRGGRGKRSGGGAKRVGADVAAKGADSS
jgi:O-antigen/teichoic acid export membrane protein